MAGKSRQPSLEPLRGRRKKKTGTCHTDKTLERKGGTGEGGQPPRSPHAQENANTQKTLIKALQCPMDQEHKESWHMCII